MKLKEVHPDKNPDKRDQAEERTKEVLAAYAVLKNPETRARYDNYGHPDDSLSAAVNAAWAQRWTPGVRSSFFDDVYRKWDYETAFRAAIGKASKGHNRLAKHAYGLLAAPAVALIGGSYLLAQQNGLDAMPFNQILPRDWLDSYQSIHAQDTEAAEFVSEKIGGAVGLVAALAYIGTVMAGKAVYDLTTGYFGFQSKSKNIASKGP